MSVKQRPRRGLGRVEKRSNGRYRASYTCPDRQLYRAQLRPTTRRQYGMLLEKFIYPTFAETRIDKVTTEDVNAWSEALAPGRETIRAQS